MDSFDRDFNRKLRQYRAAHRTVGCKICHLIGVPLIALSFPMLLFNWRRALGIFGLGCAFQIAGHALFERNKPVLSSNPANMYTYLSALVFIAQEWGALLRGHPITETPLSACTETDETLRLEGGA